MISVYSFLSACLLEERPEKDHAAQIRMMAALLGRHPEHRQAVRLLLAGGVRNEGDSARVDDLKALADSLHVSVCSLSFVSFFILRVWLMATNAGSRGICGECTVSTHFGTSWPCQRWTKHDGGRTLRDQCRGVHGKKKKSQFG